MVSQGQIFPYLPKWASLNRYSARTINLEVRRFNLLPFCKILKKSKKEMSRGATKVITLVNMMKYDDSTT